MSQADTALNLYVAQRGKLLRYARSLLDDPARAEDVVQEAWMRVASHMGQAPTDPESYLFRVVRNIALDIGRRRQFEQRHFKDNAEDEAAAVPDDTPGPESNLMARERLEIVLQALQDMPEDMRIAVEMHRFGKARLKDIAERLNISVTAAHRLLAAGVEYCRERLERPLN